MNIPNRNYSAVILLVLMVLVAPGIAAGKASEVLVSVGNSQVTAADLEMAVRSSPFAVQFNTLEEQEQAALRGDLLKRLVALRLLYLEAKSEGLDKTPEFRKELEEYRTAQLYRYYIQSMRQKLSVPEDQLQLMKKKYVGQPDILAASRSAYLSDAFRGLRLLTLRLLKETRNVVFFEDRIVNGVGQDTVLMVGDGVEIRYGDLVKPEDFPTMPDPEWVKEELYQRAELLLFAQAAEKENVNIDANALAYAEERLPALLTEKMERQWVPNDDTLKTYFNANPELSKIPARWHVGQLVVSSYAQAAALLKRINQGESLFTLAGRYSIDEYGRSHNGDMGWLKEGEGLPEFELRLKNMADGEVSGIIKTSKGYHLLTVLERRPGKTRKFEDMKDKIRQAIINDKLVGYLESLNTKYPVEWNILTANAEKEAANE
jgi:peptidyl-prolyl cis-trans isomerase C